MDDLFCPICGERMEIESHSNRGYVYDCPNDNHRWLVQIDDEDFVVELARINCGE